MLSEIKFEFENFEWILFAAGGLLTLVVIGIFAIVLTRKDKH